MNQYKEQAVSDYLGMMAGFFLDSYETASELDEAIKSGEYTGELLADKDGVPTVLATFRLEGGEGKVFFAEGSTWIVWQGDIFGRWYNENQQFIDNEYRKALTA